MKISLIHTKEELLFTNHNIIPEARGQTCKRKRKDDDEDEDDWLQVWVKSEVKLEFVHKFDNRFAYPF